MKIYKVGGCIRDQLLGIEPKDRDYVVVGSSIIEMKKAGFMQVGADFPVFLHPETNEEYALARQERKTKPGYHGFEAIFSPDVTLEMDLLRRDLTINSLAEDPNTGEIIDPYGGQEDLKNKILRHTSEAFAEDPVRILRIARFNARFPDFKIHNTTLEFMKEMIKNGEFDTLTPERIFTEFVKGLREKKPGMMFQALKRCGADKKLMEWCGYKKEESKSIHKSWMYEAIEADYLSIAEKFSIIAGAFTNTSFERWKIPNEFKDISVVVNEFSHNFRGYDDLRASDKIGFLTRLNIFQSSDRAASFCKVVDAISDAKKEKLKVFKFWPDAIKAIKVNSAEIAQKVKDRGGDGKAIKSAIFAARVAAIK